MPMQPSRSWFKKKPTSKKSPLELNKPSIEKLDKRTVILTGKVEWQEKQILEMSSDLNRAYKKINELEEAIKKNNKDRGK